MTTIEHIEADVLQAGMPVVAERREIGRLEDVLPQSDRRHALRLITRRHDNGRLIAIPIDWAAVVRDGRIVLSVSDSELSQLPDYIPIAPRENGDKRVRSFHGIGDAWLHTLLERTTGLELDAFQIAQIEDIAEQKLVTLFDVAEDAAVANGRARVMRHDLPITKGLQLQLLDVTDLERELDLVPLLAMLAEAGIRAPFDEALRSEIPRLMAALIAVVARATGVVRSDSNRPTVGSDDVERAATVVNLTL